MRQAKLLYDDNGVCVCVGTEKSIIWYDVGEKADALIHFSIWPLPFRIKTHEILLLIP